MGFLANNFWTVWSRSNRNYRSFDDMLNVAKQILTTRGVNSRVLVKGDLQKYKTCGHMGIFDFDELSKNEILNRCMDLEGINCLWESSPTGTNYHLWNLTIRSLEEIAVLGLKLGSDCKHIAHGYRMGKWVLRIAPKFQEGNKKYKPAPKLIHTWCNDSLRYQSQAHLKLFIALTGKTLLHINSYGYRGVSAEIEDYMTITDRMKAGLKL